MEKHVFRNNIKVTNRNGKYEKSRDSSESQVVCYYHRYQTIVLIPFFRRKRWGYKNYMIVHNIRYGSPSLERRTQVSAAPYS